MHKKMLSDALIAQSSSDMRFKITAEHDYATAVLTAEACSAVITVVEIPESGLWASAEKCLAICKVIRKYLPRCKQVILCNENDKDSYQASIQAKQNHVIDDFFFYDSSIHYFLTKLEALFETGKVNRRE